MPKGRPKKEVEVIVEEPKDPTVGVKTQKLSEGEIEGHPPVIKEG